MTTWLLVGGPAHGEEISEKGVVHHVVLPVEGSAEAVYEYATVATDVDEHGFPKIVAGLFRGLR